MGRSSWSILSIAIVIISVMAGGLATLIVNFKPITKQDTTETSVATADVLYDVKEVIDGDTIKIDYEGAETSVRLIGVNTPETVDPRTTVECFGQEASDYLKTLLTDKKVKIEADSTQTDRDKYDRLLRYVYLDNEDVAYKIISNGYGYEYTYNVPYEKQTSYKNAQSVAESTKRGLWADGVCSANTVEKTQDTAATTTTTNTTPAASANDTTSSTASNTECTIKGNVNSSGEKIYHVPGQKYYNSTRIDVEYGERWFCSEVEAQAAGWRRSKV